MKFELIQILRSCQCHHTGVMRTGGKFGEVNAILVAQEEFNSPKSGSRQSAGHFLCHFLRFFQVSRVNVRRLETFTVIASFLHVADRRTEQRGTVLLSNRQ